MANAREKAVAVLKQYLAQSDWNAVAIEGRDAFRAERTVGTCPTKYFFQIPEAQEQFLFYIAPEIAVLEHMFGGVTEFITRANCGMRIGNFEFDLGDGEITFRSGLNFSGADLSSELIRGAVEPALKAFDEFFPGLLKVIAGTKSPLAAVREIEYGT
jgi:hypothetical protein